MYCGLPAPGVQNPPGRRANLAPCGPACWRTWCCSICPTRCFVPFNSAARQVVCAEAGRAVRTVIVDGRVVRQDRRITTVDEAAPRAEIAELMVALVQDAAAVSARIEPIRDAILQATRRAWDMQANEGWA